MSGKHESGGSDEHERFARALETSSPCPPDEHTAEFDAELEVVELLRDSGERLGADELARARMRSRVLDSAAPTRQARGSGSRGGARWHSLRGRVAVAAAAVLCFAVVLGGLGALGSRNAVPGDPLYGVKLTMQQASVDLAGDDMSKGVRYTELASSRIAEAKQLLASGSASIHDYKVVLDNFDSDARAAASHFTRVEKGSQERALTELHNWAAHSAASLSSMREGIPRGARDRAATSIGMLGRMEHRAHALLRQVTDLAERAGSEDVARTASPDAAPAPPSPSESAPAPSQSPEERPTQRLEVRSGGGAAKPKVPAAPMPSQAAPSPEPGPTEVPSPEPPQLGLDLSPQPKTDGGQGSDHARTPEAGKHGVLGDLLGGGLGLLGGG